MSINNNNLADELKQFSDQNIKYKAYRIRKVIGFLKFCITELSVITTAIILVLNLLV